MKEIRYDLCTAVNHGTEEAPQWEQSLTPVCMEWNEANEAIARREAFRGEYSISEQADTEASAPTRLDAMEAQLAYTAMMTDTLLEG